MILCSFSLSPFIFLFPQSFFLCHSNRSYNTFLMPWLPSSHVLLLFFTSVPFCRHALPIHVSCRSSNCCTFLLRDMFAMCEAPRQMLLKLLFLARRSAALHTFAARRTTLCIRCFYGTPTYVFHFPKT